MQSTVLDIPLSSKEMYNIIENDVWKLWDLVDQLFLSSF